MVFGSIQNVPKGNLPPDLGVNVPIQISLTGSTFGEYFSSPTYGYNCLFHIVFTKWGFSDGYVVGGCPGFYDPDSFPFVRVDCGKLDC